MQTLFANVKMLAVAKNIDFRQKHPIDLFYRVCHKETFGPVGWSKLLTVWAKWVGQIKTALSDPLHVGEFWKILNLNKIDQGIRFWGQNSIYFVNKESLARAPSWQANLTDSLSFVKKIVIDLYFEKSDEDSFGT